MYYQLLIEQNIEWDLLKSTWFLKSFFPGSIEINLARAEAEMLHKVSQVIYRQQPQQHAVCCSSCWKHFKDSSYIEKGFCGSENNHKNWVSLDNQKHSLSQAKNVCVSERRKIAALQQSRHGFVYIGWQDLLLLGCLSVFLKIMLSEMVGQEDNSVHWLYIYKYRVFDKVTTGSAFKLWFNEFISYVWI